MVKVPTSEEEDRRRNCRERKTLIEERVEQVNLIKGLLFAQGIFDYDPLRNKVGIGSNSSKRAIVDLCQIT